MHEGTTATRFVVYQVFASPLSTHYAEDLSRFAAATGRRTRIGRLVLARSCEPTEAYRQRDAPWQVGERDLEARVT